MQLHPATEEQAAAWRAGNSEGRGYAPSDEIEAAVAAWAPHDIPYGLAGMPGCQRERAEVLVTPDGKTAVGDANGAWAVDIA